jgi:GNAT superfamily N-acetyltransferase
MRQRWRYRLAALVIRVQDLRIYRRMARRLVGRIDVREATPEEAVIVRARPSAVGHAQGGPSSRVTVFVAVRPRGRIAGWNYLQRNSSDTPLPGYVLTGVYVRLAYRGSGLGRWLMGAPIELARSEGAGSVLTMVSPLNKRAIELYRRLGFEPAPDVWPEWQREMDERHPSERLVMRLSL